ncbi:MAG: topoisomerase IV [Ruminococcaceae bacterium]|nr:topoisomerase IV [Oscillospiraceae bacterium]
MARKKKETVTETIIPAEVKEQFIAETLETNYMPYAMSVIISRAIPEIDGFKPAHRKLLYTMYKMGLLSSSADRTKSANVVGATMKLNPHGDMAIYETLVRLTRGNEALLHPLVDSKGSFGKQYSRMAFAASRYTEVKLESFCSELFSGIDKDAVDFVDNYDSTMKEPKLLPVSFPNVLVTPNMGIAVGMASSICSFNLAEICDTTIGLIRDEDFDITTTLLGPDFSTGGSIVYNKEQMDSIYNTGRGSVKVRSKYRFDKSNNCIEVYEIPYTTDAETIIDKLAELVKSGKVKEISDVRDEIDLKGLKIAIDVKKGTDPDKLMSKLFKLTSLEDDFSCNFNVLISGTPMLLGVKDIILEWHAYRCECLKREIYHDLQQKNSLLHLLQGLEKILLDIDRAIAIIRNTENDADVIPNLCDGFDIDELQAEYVAEIKLRNLNKEHILKKTAQIKNLKEEIEELESILKSSSKLNRLIIKQLTQIKEKYGKPRKTDILYSDVVIYNPAEEPEEEFKAHAVFTQEGYFKRISLQSMRGSDVQKLKDGDKILFSSEISSKNELIFFTDKAQAYKTKLSNFESVKASALGEYVPVKLGFDNDEKVIFFAPVDDFNKRLFIAFENGKCVIIPLSGFETKNNRKKLTGAFCPTQSVAFMMVLDKGEEKEVFLKTHLGKALVINTALVPLKSTKTSQGVQVISLKPTDKVEFVCPVETMPKKPLPKYRKTKIPSAGMVYNEIDIDENQTTLI